MKDKTTLEETANYTAFLGTLYDFLPENSPSLRRIIKENLDNLITTHAQEVAAEGREKLVKGIKEVMLQNCGCHGTGTEPADTYDPDYYPAKDCTEDWCIELRKIVAETKENT